MNSVLVCVLITVCEYVDLRLNEAIPNYIYKERPKIVQIPNNRDDDCLVKQTHTLFASLPRAGRARATSRRAAPPAARRAPRAALGATPEEVACLASWPAGADVSTATCGRANAHPPPLLVAAEPASSAAIENVKRLVALQGPSGGQLQAALDLIAAVRC